MLEYYAAHGRPANAAERYQQDLIDFFEFRKSVVEKEKALRERTRTETMGAVPKRPSSRS